MELLQLVFFSGGYLLLESNTFYMLLLINLLLKCVRRVNMTIPNTNDIDIVTVFINIISLSLNLFIFQMNMLYGILNNNYYCNKVFVLYDYLNSKYLFVRSAMLQTIIMAPLKYLFSHNINKNMKIGENDKVKEVLKRNKEVKLENNKDISNFLDNLLDKKIK